MSQVPVEPPATISTGNPAPSIIVRLAQLGAGDAERPRAHLTPGDLGAAVRLRVRPEVLAGGARMRGHPADVPLEAVEVEEQRRRRNVVACHSKTALTLARAPSAQALEVPLLDAAGDVVVEVWAPVRGGRSLLAQEILGALRALVLGGHALGVAHRLVERGCWMHDGAARRGLAGAPKLEHRGILARRLLRRDGHRQ